MYSFVDSFVSWISVNKVSYLTLVNLSSYYQCLTVVCHLTVQRIGIGQRAIVVIVAADAGVYCTDIAAVGQMTKNLTTIL